MNALILLILAIPLLGAPVGHVFGHARPCEGSRCESASIVARTTEFIVIAPKAEADGAPPLHAPSRAGDAGKRHRHVEPPGPYRSPPTTGLAVRERRPALSPRPDGPFPRPAPTPSPDELDDAFGILETVSWRPPPYVDPEHRLWDHPEAAELRRHRDTDPDLRIAHSADGLETVPERTDETSRGAPTAFHHGAGRAAGNGTREVPLVRLLVYCQIAIGFALIAIGLYLFRAAVFASYAFANSAPGRASTRLLDGALLTAFGFGVALSIMITKAVVG